MIEHPNQKEVHMLVQELKVKQEIASAANWPTPNEIGLTASAVALRRHGIGGSDANIIFSANPERVHGLWLEKRGDIAPADL